MATVTAGYVADLPSFSPTLRFRFVGSPWSEYGRLDPRPVNRVRDGKMGITQINRLT
ncbi:hypothetical protein [Tropicimonas aquimaris]|uniref:Uncharacterized protein n=1 Tax=Tropicimonas aquimaris TaxID=914152 RepID=A0ABW3ISB9_9RHOB